MDEFQEELAAMIHAKSELDKLDQNAVERILDYLRAWNAARPASAR